MITLAYGDIRRDLWTMGEIVNLNRARKSRQKIAARLDAAANRALHGLTKAQRDAARFERDRAARLIDGHRRKDGAEDTGLE